MDKRKNVIIGALLVAIVLMSVGYAALSTVLKINATGTVTGDFKVEITSVKVKDGSVVAAESKTASGSGTTATLSAELQKPGSTITYLVDIKNTGNIDATLKSITDLATINAADPADVKFTISGATANSDLAVGATETYEITVTWDAAATVIPEVKTKTATIDFTYEQKM